MKYKELVEFRSAEERMWDAKKSTHDALRDYRAKQRKAGEARAAAMSLEPGPERTRRSRKAQEMEASAKRGYAEKISKANNKMSDLKRR